ncbi:ubiquitin-specific protease doa4 [Arachnomyces sp. PD_36]|nr:ubiquitin-specific protease doa4 [Arachnomyces sp. PD_36]
MTSDLGPLPAAPDVPPWRDGTPKLDNFTGSYRVGGQGRPASSQGGPYPHIRDLQARATSSELGNDVSLNELLRTAQESLLQSNVLIDQGQLDLAYVHFLRSSEITVNIIPQHPDFRPGIRELTDLMLSIRSKDGIMSSVKQQILDDNARTGVTASVDQYTPSSSTPSSPQRDNSRAGVNHVEDGTRMASPTKFQRYSMNGVEGGYRQRPEVKPKPEGLFSKPPTAKATTSEDLLARRFAQLRTNSSNGEQRNSISHDRNGASQDGVIAMPSPADFEQPSRPPPPVPRGHTPSASVTRPLGPRSMNSSTSNPTPPPKIPIAPVNASLPRAPSPAYSPVFSAPSQPPLVPPRTSTDSARSTGSRYQPALAGSRRGSPSRSAYDDNPYRSRTPNGVHPAKEKISSSADLPHSTVIHAEQLLEFLRKYNILLIDVRSRSDYDSGHIYVKSIICIDPIVLNENVSAEELEERLVVSPEFEQSLFEKRNEFDLVVYYDQNTSSTSYLAGSPANTSSPPLRALYDTLYEFNAYKPLRDGRPPALLVGGIDAWIDLVGQHSLATSQTAAVIDSIRTTMKPLGSGRPIGRVPTVASANSSLEVRKRRLREYRPLNPEEERAWLEKARNEEIDPSTYEGDDEASITEEPEDLESAEQEPASSFIHTYEDFLRRFPEPRQIRESMIIPEAPLSMPPVPLHDTSIPSVPSRPPPAIPRPSYSGVSDGRQIQPHLARQNSATKTALYTSNSFISKLRLPRTGLVNFGVTCYMNSTVQCLSATILLSKFFIDNRYRYYVQKNWKGSQGIMPGLYANLIRSLWKNDVEVIMPTSFRNFCGRMNREWAIDRQQDAKEFFDFLVDCLHEDLNINWQRTPLRPLTFEEELQRERMPIHRVSNIEWDRYCHREESYMTSLFAGQHASRLRCTTCRLTSTTYEAFYSISVEIPRSGSADIYQCLQSYCKEEMLSGDEVWKCPHCRREREATKQIILTRAPQLLVIHFKRFSASKTQSTRKIHTPIDFPLHNLNMDPFMIQPPESTTQQPSSSSKPPPPSTTPPYTYNAYAVLRHIGQSSGGGHYISHVRDPQRDTWRRFDDDRVTDFNPRDMRFGDRLQNEQAYIVFYERVGAK